MILPFMGVIFLHSPSVEVGRGRQLSSWVVFNGRPTTHYNVKDCMDPEVSDMRFRLVAVVLSGLLAFRFYGLRFWWLGGLVFKVRVHY